MTGPTLIVGCGYLGRRVARRLLDRGNRVLGTTRSPATAADLAHAGVEPLLLDVLDETAASTLPAADRAVLCVGHDRRAAADRRAVGVDGLRRVLDHLAARGLRRVVYTGSVSIYGQAAGDWVDETSPTEPDGEPGRVQVEAEAALRSAFPPLIVLRVGGLYGRGRVLHRDAILRGQPLRGDPHRWLNLIHVEDAARAVVAALDATDPPPVVNACDDRPVTRLECVEATARSLDLPPPTWAPGDDPPEPSRRVSNARLKATLLPILDYPTIAEGIPASLAAM
jgi:nucleoside-diphosphate-sugar epimerase